MTLPAFSLAVVGADYPNKKGPGRRFEIAMCTPGETITLVPEPENPADENAVAVYSARGVQIGYLSAERAPWIGSMLRSGRILEAVYQEPARFGAVIRAAFDGEFPTLPIPSQISETAEPEADWWPDEEWPDD